MRFSFVLKVCLLSALLLTSSLNAADKKTWAENYNIPLWGEGKVPLADGTGPLDSPFLTVFLPPEGKRNGGSVIVAPGGSNIMLMYGCEGIEIAERFNDWGFAAFVLTYRMSPRYNEAARIADGKRAMQVVRSRAVGVETRSRQESVLQGSPQVPRWRVTSRPRRALGTPTPPIRSTN